MRFLAILPVLCCTAALILSFLCLFAGHKKGFMEDYSLITLNTSAVGENIITKPFSSSSSTLSSLWDLIPDSITDGVTNEINEQVDKFRSRVGIQDFYSAHMLNYCEGQYTPIETPNATVRESDISKNVTACSKSRATYKFNPTQIIQSALDKSGVDVTLADLKWPEDLQDGIDAVNMLMAAMFVLYVLAICLIFLTLVASALSFFLATASRLTPCVNFLLALLAFLAIGLASTLVTAVMVKGTDVLNEHGDTVGLRADRGSKFLGITWAATGLMAVAVAAWVVGFCVRPKQRRGVGEKAQMAQHRTAYD